MKIETLLAINQQVDEAMKSGRNLKVSAKELEKGDLVVFKHEGQDAQAVQVVGGKKSNVNSGQVELYHASMLNEVSM